MTFDDLQNTGGVEPRFADRDRPIQSQQRPTETDAAALAVAEPKSATAEASASRTSGRRCLGDEPPSPTAAAAAKPAPDAAEMEWLMVRLCCEQRVGAALAGGLAAAVLGAILWGAVTFITGYQIGYAAIGLGVLVGGAVRTLGRGMTKPFGFIGGALAGGGCLLGNLLCIYAFIAQQEQMPLALVFANINPAAIAELLAVTFSPMDLLFYGIAVYAGYRFSFREVTPAEATRIVANEAAAPKG